MMVRPVYSYFHYVRYIYTGNAISRTKNRAIELKHALYPCRCGLVVPAILDRREILFPPPLYYGCLFRTLITLMMSPGGFWSLF